MRPIYLLGLLIGLLAAEGRAQALIPYRVGSRWGYANARRRLVIRPRYDYAERFDQGLARVWRGDKCGFIDRRGREVVPVRFDRAGYTRRFEPVYARPSRHPSDEWAGGEGRVVVMLHDTTALPAYPGGPRRQPVRPTGWAAWLGPQTEADNALRYWVGLYDTTGRELLAPRYAYIRRGPDGLLRVGQVAELYSGSVTELHGPDGTHAHRTEYYDYPLYKEQLYTAQGRLLLQGRAYPHIGEIRHGRVRVQSQGHPFDLQMESMQDTARRPRVDSTALDWYGQIDDATTPWHVGSEVRSADDSPYPPYYADHDEGWAEEYDEYNQPLPQPHLFLLDSAYRPVSRRRFTYLQYVGGRRMLAGIRDSATFADQSGILDPLTGRWVLAPRYERLRPHTAGRYFARQAQQWGIIDSLGRWLLVPRYQALTPLAGGHYLARQGGRWGVVDGQGRWMHPPTYDVFEKGLLSEGRQLVRQAQQWGVIDSLGRQLVAPRYDQLEADMDGPDYIARCRVGEQFDEDTGAMGSSWRSGAVDGAGRVVLPLVYEDVTRMRALVPRKGKDPESFSLPLWLTQSGRVATLRTPTARLLQLDAAYTVGFFEQGRARLYRPNWEAPTDSVIVLDTLAGRPRARLLRQPLPRPDSATVQISQWWVDAGGRGLTERWRLNPACPHDPPGTRSDHSEERLYGLFRADSSVVLPLQFHALTPLRRQTDSLDDAGSAIENNLVVRIGGLYGVYTTAGRPVLPVQYEYIALVPGAPELFWVLLPDGYAAIDARQRVWHHTHSRAFPDLPAHYVDGYGVVFERQTDIKRPPLGYQDAHGRPFYRGQPPAAGTEP